MMVMTDAQRQVVEQNMGLVGKVIKDKVRGLGQAGAFTYDDLYQIGCIGLCKAAVTDKGGCFSTYAYRLIWNEICDALIKSTRIQSTELVMEAQDIVRRAREDLPDPLESCELKQILAQAQKGTSGVTAKGIQCLLLQVDGYSSKELSQIYGASSASIRMWMTKARRYLQSVPELAVRGGAAVRISEEDDK